HRPSSRSRQRTPARGRFGASRTSARQRRRSARSTSARRSRRSYSFEKRLRVAAQERQSVGGMQSDGAADEKSLNRSPLESRELKRSSMYVGLSRHHTRNI